MDRYAILTVCTANICRSPLMEMLLRRRLDSDVFEVSSAGVQGWESQPMDADAAAQLRRLGSDPGEFRSRPFTARIVEGSDLILTATREHRAGVLSVCPSALRRTFTLREFDALVADTDAASLHDLTDQAVRRRSQAPAMVDIGDPFQQGELVHQQIAEQINGAVGRVAEALNMAAANSPDAS